MMYDAEGTVMEGTMTIREALERLVAAIDEDRTYAGSPHAEHPPGECPTCDIIRAADQARAALSAAVPEPEIAAHGLIEYDDHDEWLVENDPNGEGAARVVAKDVPRWFGRLVVAALSRPLSQTAVGDSHQVEADLPELGEPPHRRSAPQDYDPTPICDYCFKAWDEGSGLGGYLQEYRCPESPAALRAAATEADLPATLLRARVAALAGDFTTEREAGYNDGIAAALEVIDDG